MEQLALGIQLIPSVTQEIIEQVSGVFPFEISLQVNTRQIKEFVSQRHGPSFALATEHAFDVL